MEDMQQIVLVLTTSSTIYIYASTWGFKSTTFITAPEILLPCLDASVAGMPAKLTFTADGSYSVTGYTIRVDLSVGTTFKNNNDLEDDSVYPGNSGTFKLATGGNLYYESSSLSSTPVTDTVPLPAIAAGDLILTVEAYLVKDGSDDILIFEGTSATVATVDSAAGGLLLNSDDADVTDDVSTPLAITLGQAIVSGSSTTNAQYFFVMLMPYGLTSTDSNIATKLTSTTYFDYYYAYSSSFTVDETAVYSETIDVTLPWYEATSTLYVFTGIGAISPFSGITCTYDDMSVITQNAGSLTFKSITPSSISGYTWSNQETDVTLTLTSTKAIPEGTTFSITLNQLSGCDSTPTVTIDGSAGNPTVNDAVAGKDVVIKYTNCNLIEALSVDGEILAATSVTAVYKSYLFLSWTDSGVQSRIVIKKNTPVTEKVSNAKLWVFPDVVGSTDVYFGIDFTFDAAIPYVPSGSTIAITGTFSSKSDASEDTWCNFKFSSSVASSNTLTITTAQLLPNKFSVSCVVDLAFDLDTATPDAVLVTVTESNDDVEIVLDVSTTQKYVVNAAPTKTLSFEVAASNSNAGFSSVHTFDITFDDATDEEFCVYFDNTGYNAEAGMTINFEDLPDYYFLYAYDSDMVFVPCMTVHWVIACMVYTQYEETETLSISFLLDNPPETGSWGVFVTDVLDVIDFVPAYLTDDLVFTNTLGDDIDLYFADMVFGEPEDYLYHAVELSAFVDIEATSGSVFLVTFPHCYDFDEYPLDTISCSLDYEQVVDSETVPLPLLTEAECEVVGNMVVFTLEADQTFTSDFWTTFYIYDAITPDMEDNSDREFIYESSDHEFYTETFCIAYGNEESGYLSSSFDNLNAAFAGYDESLLEPLVVNMGEPILITPGTWSGPYYIKNEEGKLKVKDITLTWETDLNSIEISLDQDEYFFDYKSPWVEFFVGVASAPSGELIEEGLYTIEWDIEQTPFKNGDDVYCRPRNTLVEVVYSKIFSVVLNPPIIYVPSSGWSMPINLQISQGSGRDFQPLPYESIEIAFDEDSTLGLKYRPNPLVLTNDSPAGFVSIMCTECTADSVVPISVSVEGEDAEVFQMEKDDYTFIYASRYDVEATLELSILEDKPNPTSFTLNLNSNQIGLATLCVIGEDAYQKNPEQAEFDFIFNNSFILGDEPNDKPDLDKLKENHKERMKEIDDEAEDYRHQTQMKLNQGRNVYYPAQVMILTVGDNNLGEFTNLVPNSLYRVFVYFDNFDGNEQEPLELNVTTGASPPHAKVTFAFSEAPSKEDFIATMIQILQLPETNLNLDDAAFGSRRLADSTVYVYSDISSDTSAYDSVTSSESDIETETSSTVTVESVDETDYDPGEFDGDVSWTLDNGIYVALNYSAKVDGSLICTIEGNGTTLTSNQVYEGVNADGDDVNQYIEDILEGDNYWSVNMTRYEDGDYKYTVYGTYHVSCIVCNDYPGTPTCSDVEDTHYEFTGESDNSSGAEALVVAFAAYFLF